MATFVLAQIDAAIGLFTSLTQHGASTPRYRRNLKWLLKLRARASSKISAASTAQNVDLKRDINRITSEDREDGEDAELLGWRTKLIERAGQDRPTVSAIRLAATPTGSHVSNLYNPLPNQNHYGTPQDQLSAADMPISSTSMPFTAINPTDDLVR